MPFTFTWDAAFEAVPAGSDNAADGDDAIRNFKEAFRERFDVDHSITGTSDDGQHKLVTFKRRTSDPATTAGKLYLYTKDADSKVSLYCLDEDGNVFRMTRTGNLLAGASYLSQDGAAEGPRFKLIRHSNNPGNGHTVGVLEWRMYNSSGAEVVGGKIDGFIVSATAGAHDMLLTFKTAIAGTVANRFLMRQGFYAQGLNDVALGCLNANGIYIQGKECKIRHYGTRATMDPVIANTAIAPTAHGITVPTGFDSAGYFARVLLEVKAGSGAQLGYAEGQMIGLDAIVSDSGSSRGIVGFADATNVSLAVRGNPFLVAADALSAAQIDPTKWKAHVDPYVELSYPAEP